MVRWAHHIADEHRLTPMASQCHPEALEGQPKSTNRSLSIMFRPKRETLSFLEMTTYSNILLLLTKVNVHFIVSILFIILFLGSCSDPFPKGALFDLMILQKLVSGESLATTTTTSNKYIFLTVGTYTGALIGGITGADAKCQTEKTANFANVPGAATEYKALLVNQLATRRACSTANCSTGISENLDWVLKANTDYFRLDGSTDTKIFTTNASGIVNFTGAGATLLTSIDSSAATVWWTGLFDDWTTNFTCSNNNWDNNAGFGGKGNGGNTGSASIDIGTTDSCNGPTNKLLCVRQ